MTAQESTDRQVRWKKAQELNRGTMNELAWATVIFVLIGAISYSLHTIFGWIQPLTPSQDSLFSFVTQVVFFVAVLYAVAAHMSFMLQKKIDEKANDER